jgi:hypothetical protein
MNPLVALVVLVVCVASLFVLPAIARKQRAKAYQENTNRILAGEEGDRIRRVHAILKKDCGCEICRMDRSATKR